MEKSRKRVEPLGASEFAATLNGDNPAAILDALKRFTKTVRRERRIALSPDGGNNVESDRGDEDSISDQSDDENDDDDADNNDKQPATKKLKKTELWKEDTKAYQVPFVGTAIARGDVATVVKGQWPTGLLKTYLTKSPMAIELTGDDWIPSSTSSIHKSLLRRKQTKVSRAIYRAYLRALGELVTAAIPLHKLQDDVSSSEEDGDKMELDGEEVQVHPFLPVLLKKRLVGMFRLLADETDKGRGKPGVYGGCGSLVPSTIKFLQNVSQTSIANARLVCRYMDEELPDGVLRALLRPPPPPHDATNEDAKSINTDKKATRLVKDARTEAIRLATILFKSGDTAVATYISTAGSRERKVKPGILHGAFREGIAKHSGAGSFSEIGHGDDYFDAVAELFAFSRKLLQNPNLSKVVGPRLLLELFARDPLFHLSAISSFAPPLSTTMNYRHVLEGIDEMEVGENESLSKVGTEARRLLYLLLANRKESPLLASLASKVQPHMLVSVMVRILHSKQAGMQERNFLLHCINVSPSLLPEIFRILSIPDSKKSFEFLSIVRFVSMLMDIGPAPCACVDYPLEAMFDNESKEMLPLLWPLKLYRQSLGRAMQSGNSLLLLECIKCVHNSLKRFKSMMVDIPKEHRTEAFKSNLAHEYAQLLPDIQLLLAVRARYDLSSDQTATNLVCQGIHVLLEIYAKILPESIQKSNFDWMKLLPDRRVFLSSKKLVQRRITSCLLSILKTGASNTVNNLAAGGSVALILEIMMSTKDDVVYKQLHEIAEVILLPIVGARSPNEESLEYIKTELLWWLDAVTLPALPAFCDLISLVDSDSLAVLGRNGKALEKMVERSELNWSILMIAALSESQLDNSLQLMVVQVATRVLLFQRNPVPFATFILLTSERNSTLLDTVSGRCLVEYVESIIMFQQTASKTRMSRLKNLIETVFTRKHMFRRMLDSLVSDQTSIDSWILSSPPMSVEVARFSIHLHMISIGMYEARNVCNVVLRQTIPPLLLLAATTSQSHSLLVIEDLKSISEEAHLSISEVLVISFPSAMGILEGKSFLKASDVVSLASKSSRINLLRLALFGRSRSASEIVQAQLDLMHHWPSSFPVSILSDIVFGLVPCNQAECSNHSWELNVIQGLVDFWLSLFTENGTDVFPLDEKYRLVAYFGRSISSILASETVESTYLLTQLVQKGDAIIVQRSMEAIVLSNGLGNSNNHDAVSENDAVLRSLLQSDPLRYAPYFLTKFSDQEFLRSKHWNQGFFDQASKAMIVHQSFSCLARNSLATFGSAIFNRAMICFEDIQNGKWEGREDLALDLANHVLLSAITDLPMDSFSTSFTGLLAFLVRTQEVLGPPLLKQIGKLGMACWQRSKKFSLNENTWSRRLASGLFCVLCDAMLKFFKRRARGNESESEVDYIATLQFLTTLVVEQHEFDEDIVARATNTLLQKLCRSALKYGIHDDAGNSKDLATAALRFVSILLHKSSGEEILMDHFSFISPSGLFGMLRNHSKFVAMVSRKRVPGFFDSDKIELLRLMCRCIELSKDEIVVDAGLWQVLSATYSAGLDELDLTIRRFFFLCTTIKSENIDLPYLDEVRWSGCDVGISREGRRWDWFIDALDIARIRATILRFPVQDSTDLASLNAEGMVPMQPSPIDGDGVGTTGNENSDDDEDITQKVEMSMKLPLEAVQLANVGIEANMQGKVDSRYSPVFMLPLILGALDSCVTEDGDKGGLDVLDDVEAPGNPQDSMGATGSGTLVAMAKRLVEKGVHAFCLSCLASSCEKVRRHAVAILGLLLHACNSDEARAMSSWRERPQIALLLNAVQRALVLDRAKNRTGLAVTPPIPVLPTLVSTFLARASLSISKPDDALYVPLNRFFLKTEIDHGAFQDMYRLPGFIALFCSASDDPLQSRKERMWALQLIRDGFQDASSYRLVSACHAPELILSSFENVRFSFFSEEMKSAEYILLFDTIKTFLSNGGSRAASHLIGKIGLLSWLQVICTRCPVAETFPVAASRFALCELIHLAVVSTLSNDDLLKPPLLDEICGLIRPILQLSMLPEGEKGYKSKALLTAGQTLVVLRAILLRLKEVDFIERPKVHPSGLTLLESMNFLNATQTDTNSRHEYPGVLCDLPCRLGEGPMEQSIGGEFCKFLLLWIAESKVNDFLTSSMTAVLERVVLIANHFGGFDSNSTTDLTRILLSSRSQYQGSKEMATLWYDCLKVLSLTLPGDSMEAQLALKILDQRL